MGGLRAGGAARKWVRRGRRTLLRAVFFERAAHSVFGPARRARVVFRYGLLPKRRSGVVDRRENVCCAATRPRGSSVQIASRAPPCPRTDLGCRTRAEALCTSDACCHRPLGSNSRPRRRARWQWGFGEAAIAFGCAPATRRRAVSVSGLAFVLLTATRCESEALRDACAALPTKTCQGSRSTELQRRAPAAALQEEPRH